MTSNYKTIQENLYIERTSLIVQPTTISQCLDIAISRFIDSRLPADGDLMISVLHGTPDQAVWVRALAGVFVFIYLFIYILCLNRHT